MTRTRPPTARSAPSPSASAQRGRARARDADPAADREGDGGHGAGRAARGVSAKDIILGDHQPHRDRRRRRPRRSSTAASAIRALSMEGRMTICNMSIEAGARAGMVAPDDTTFAYVEGRPHAPKGADWEAALDDVADPAERPRRDVRCRGGGRCGRAEALRELGHQPGADGHDRRRRARPRRLSTNRRSATRPPVRSRTWT